MTELEPLDELEPEAIGEADEDADTERDGLAEPLLLALAEPELELEPDAEADIDGLVLDVGVETEECDGIGERDGVALDDVVGFGVVDAVIDAVTERDTLVLDVTVGDDEDDGDLVLECEGLAVRLLVSDTVALGVGDLDVLPDLEPVDDGVLDGDWVPLTVLLGEAVWVELALPERLPLALAEPEADDEPEEDPEAETEADADADDDELEVVLPVAEGEPVGEAD